MDYRYYKFYNMIYIHTCNMRQYISINKSINNHRRHRHIMSSSSCSHRRRDHGHSCHDHVIIVIDVIIVIIITSSSSSRHRYRHRHRHGGRSDGDCLVFTVVCVPTTRVGSIFTTLPPRRTSVHPKVNRPSFGPTRVTVGSSVVSGHGSHGVTPMIVFGERG